MTAPRKLTVALLALSTLCAVLCAGLSHRAQAGAQQQAGIEGEDDIPTALAWAGIEGEDDIPTA